MERIREGKIPPVPFPFSLSFPHRYITMATPNEELIHHLRNIANMIESGEWHYDWWTAEQCNCGLLVRSVLGRPYTVPIGSWGIDTRGEEGTYSTTGIKLKKILDELKSLGLTREDLGELERLENLEVKNRLGIEQGGYIDPKNKQNTIRYLRAWADLLEEKLEKTEDLSGDSLPQEPEEMVLQPA